MTYNEIAKSDKVTLYGTVIVLVIFFALLFIDLHLISVEKQLIKNIILNDAKNYTKIIKEFRSLYTSEVVERVQGKDIVVSHDYSKIQGAIPLPATLSIRIGNAISSDIDKPKVKLYSPYPFPWREQDSGLEEGFEKQAWQKLNETPDEAFYEYGNENGRIYIKYAVADKLRPACVSCHNNHPDSPKRNWEIGDVRGILQVTIPVDTTTDAVFNELKRDIVIMLAFFGVGFFAIICLIIYHKNIKAAELAEIHEANKAAKENAEEATRTKNRFLALVSHEIRTPINGITGMVDILLGTKLTQEQKERLQAIKKSNERLTTIVEDVLDFTKTQSGNIKVDKSPFELKSLVEDIVETLKPSIKDKGLVFKIDIDTSVPHFISQDKKLIGQVLIKLVSNAIKFTDSGHIIIAATLEEVDEKSLLKFEIKDSGVGIRQDKIDKLFDVFGKSDLSDASKQGGIGLGLVICKNIISTLKGEIGVSSKLNVGSCFWFNVPVDVLSEEEVIKQKANDIGNAITTGKAIQANSYNILLVEDTEINVQVSTAMLKKLGCNISIAKNGLEAIVNYKNDDFDLIFMDCQMPEMDGYEATKRIRKIEENREFKTPIVALTANVGDEFREKCLAAGMDDYLTKPYKINHLSEMIQKWVVKEEK